VKRIGTFLEAKNFYEAEDKKNRQPGAGRLLEERKLHQGGRVGYHDEKEERK